MANQNSNRLEQLRQLRDEKVKPHLKQYAPVWMVDEVPIFKDDTLQFNVVFYHPRYGWVNRRYRFDGFNQVLYHHGQTLLSEEEALVVTDRKAYLSAETVNTVDSYGG